MRKINSSKMVKAIDINCINIFLLARSITLTIMILTFKNMGCNPINPIKVYQKGRVDVTN